MSKSNRFLALALLLFALLVAGLSIVLWVAPEARATTISTPLSTADDMSTANIMPFANPEVIGVNPVSNTHTAPPTTTVSITYNKNISAATVSTRTFAVHAMQTGLLAQTYGVNGATISLTPTQPFKPGELVQTSATTGTLYLDGTEPASPTVWQFWTAVVEGSGVFSDSGQSLGNSYSRAVALGDVDGDGDLDAFVGNEGGANKVWRNDGAGTFTDSGQTLGSSLSFAVALGDVDGDSDLDAFVANNAQANKVWLNDGAGTFTDSGQTLGSSDSEAVAFGDVDGDGDLDAFVGNYLGQANRVWVNDGAGTFTDSGQTLGSSDSYAVAFGDVDGDGDLDAFVGNYVGQANRVWVNDGAGTFTNSGQSLGDSWSQAVALGDVDGDGDLDAFVGNGWGDLPNKVWVNDGAGTFTDSGQSLGSSLSEAVALGDVDGDGDLDAFVGNGWGDPPNKVWVNDGAGNFTDSGQSLGNYRSYAVALGDVDGDGDLDALVANAVDAWGFGQANKVWRNLKPPNLAIGKHAPSQVPPGGLLAYTIVVSETGGMGYADATGVQVTDTVPVSTTCCASFGGGSLVGNDVTWTGLTITKGQSISLTFVVRVGQVPSGTIITNDAYRVVTSTQGVNTGLGSAVTTTVWAGPVYLPIIQKSSVITP